MPVHLAEHIAQNRYVPGIFIARNDADGWEDFTGADTAIAPYS